jgi:hypothetical protein
MAQTYSGCGTKIEKNLALFQKTVLLIELNQFEGCTGAVSFLFCKLVPLVQTTLAML